MNALIVDDSRAMLALIGRLLRKLEYRVAAFSTAESSLFHVDAGHPLDAAVVDLRLADGDGIDVVVALRARRPDLRIVVCTSDATSRTRVRAFAAGADAVVVKPPTESSLQQALYAVSP